MVAVSRWRQHGWLLVACALALLAGLHMRAASQPQATPARDTARQARTSEMTIHLTINGQVLRATLEDSSAARDFLSLLPLTFDLEDYNATEKVAQLPRKLSTAGSPAGIRPEVGDLTYYAPWGNLAIFYKDFGYSRGLVRLGHIEGDIAVLRSAGPLKAVISVAGRN